MRRNAGFLLVFLAVVASASAQEVSLDYDRAFDFTLYRTFAWSPAQQPAKNPANHIRITRAVEEALRPKGVAKNEDGRPDVYLMYHGKVGDKVKVRSKSTGGYWEPSNLRTVVDVDKVREGTLVLEMYNARTKELSWRGVATSVGVREDRMEEDIKAAVKKLLEDYPPKKPEADPRP